jgi:S1-C subfamily serine protease
MITDYQILSANDDLVSEVINFFTAKETNPKLFEEIKKICIERNNKVVYPNGENYIKSGILSHYDFLMYMSETNKAQSGIKTHFVEITLKQLVKHYILEPLDSVVGHKQAPRYRVSGKYAKMMCDQGLIKNLLYGFNYIISEYKNSVVKIEHFDKNGDSSIGTGFLIAERIENHNIIVTNRHVIQGNSRLKMFTHDDKEIQIINVLEDDERDIALIEIENYNGKPFILSDTIEVMKEIITIGYPTIPTTKYAYQVYHKGEVNSFVENFWNNKLFLISAKTSSGNSGSPIIDSSGVILGIITEELFEQDKFFQKGKLPYYAGIPTTEIFKSIIKYKN